MPGLERAEGPLTPAFTHAAPFHNHVSAWGPEEELPPKRTMRPRAESKAWPVPKRGVGPGAERRDHAEPFHSQVSLRLVFVAFKPPKTTAHWRWSSQTMAGED